jgi:hypothetical protein
LYCLVLDRPALAERIREFENLALRLKMEEKAVLAKGKELNMILFDI